MDEKEKQNIRNQIAILNKALREEDFPYRENCYSYAAGFLQGLLEGIVGERFVINYGKGEEK